MDAHIRHFSEIQKPAQIGILSSKWVAYQDADFGRELGLSRIAIHQVVIPPHHRSSLPHAESHEEEFVYVLSGSPQAWINGELFQLVTQDILAFESGTGIAHTIINNTDEDVHILVVGERTKIENLCSFPINPEIEKWTKIWWSLPSPQLVGTHDGLPQNISSSDYKVKMFKDRPDLICNLIQIRQQESLPYPGDDEMFSEGRRLGKDLGLKRLGIWHEQIKPGRRTSWPHAHMIEEEFVYVLSGTPQVWLHGHLRTLKAGDGVAFPAGTGLSHTFINNSDSNCEIMVIGESALENDRIFYPLHPDRNQQCRIHGWLWENHPQIQLGPDLSSPKSVVTSKVENNELTKMQQSLDL